MFSNFNVPFTLVKHWRELQTEVWFKCGKKIDSEINFYLILLPGRERKNRKGDFIFHSLPLLPSAKPLCPITLNCSLHTRLQLHRCPEENFIHVYVEKFSTKRWSSPWRQGSVPVLGDEKEHLTQEEWLAGRYLRRLKCWLFSFVWGEKCVQQEMEMGTCLCPCPHEKPQFCHVQGRGGGTWPYVVMHTTGLTLLDG